MSRWSPEFLPRVGRSMTVSHRQLRPVPLEHCDYKGGSSEGKKVVCACKKAGVVCIYDIWERKF